ncbi:hypothetical protein DOTSEDRAFT_73268 [Dothistroma septosporum NZE10]|uniref:Uncharacterized protein n=1 Tax=Dothistroma septosporum (strain NZE10 / CBS 128990) TaxID=675120 RepID=N1PJT7_DOTSN|nr:hypothetical protein DOTSEDRAFT_73268 [Dothistroma septosporum NZE10]
MAFLELLDAGNRRRSPSLPSSQVLSIGSVGALCLMTDSFIYDASKGGATHLMKNLGISCSARYSDECNRARMLSE